MSESEMAVHGHGGALMEESPYSIPSRKLTMWLFVDTRSRGSGVSAGPKRVGESTRSFSLLVAGESKHGGFALRLWKNP